MNQSFAAETTPKRTHLPSWLTLPSAGLFAASFGVRTAALFEREFAVACVTLAVDAPLILAALAVGSLPVQTLRALRVTAPPWQAFLRSALLRIVVGTVVGLAAFGWVYWGPLRPIAAAVMAYAITLPVAVTAAIILRRRSLG